MDPKQTPPVSPKPAHAKNPEETTVVTKDSDRRASRLKRMSRTGGPGNQPKKPVYMDFKRAEEQVRRLAYGYLVSNISDKNNPNILTLLVMPETKKSLNIVKGLADRIRSDLGPSVLKAEPYQPGPNQPGGLRVQIARQVTVAAFLCAGVSRMGGHTLKRLYAGISDAALEARLNNVSLDAVKDRLSIDDSMIEAALQNVYGSHITGAEELDKDLKSWSNPAILHFSHAISPIKIKLKTGKELEIAKGDPFGYNIAGGILKLTFPAHGVVSPVTIEALPVYVDWLKNSDKKYSRVIDKLLGLAA